MTKRRWLSVLTPAPPCAETASGRPELRRREGRNAQRASPQKAVRPRSGTGMPACRRLPRPAGTPGRSRRLPRSPDVPPGRRVPFVSLPAVLLLLLLLQLLAAPRPTAAEAFDARLARLRAEAREMFLHAWRGYLEYAFPEDELDPLRCKGRGKSKKPRFSENDVLGGYSLTLVDTLDALALLGEQEEFEKAVRLAIDHVHFDLDSTVLVFEVTIRMLGGLLSAHQLASDPELPTFVPWYDGQLLRMAHDLGKRLLPAFDSSPSGIPYPKVNLRAGLPPDAAGENCLAGAGTLVLEFGVLSRLTDDARFETAAKKSMAELWRRRSDIDLLGNVINVTSGLWSHTASSVGAGADSFFEYLMKAYILFGECDYFHVFEVAYNAIMARVRDPTGYVLRNVDMLTGMLVAPWVDSLAAFFPGLQVLAGDVESAVRIHLFYNALWQRYGALPERFDFYNQEAINSHYPLRPEFIESTYMLYQATKNQFYIDVGENVMQDIQTNARTRCGFAAIADVHNMTLDSRMESFTLSETLKYLYLLFDPDHPLSRADSNFVFTTEAHPLFLPRAHPTPASCAHGRPPPSCPVFDPARPIGFSSRGPRRPHVLARSMWERPEADVARALAGHPWGDSFPPPDGTCEFVPSAPVNGKTAGVPPGPMVGMAVAEPEVDAGPMTCEIDEDG